jgi:myo-inositol-1(or 4)-monophosphatase
MDLEKITKQVIELSKSVGEFIRGEKEKINSDVIENKGVHDFVTYVDKTAEQKLIDGLLKIIPNSGFIAEENTADYKGEEYRWIVDPLDGTTNFIHGLTPFAISIALQKNEETIAGIVYEIGLDECFYAYKNSGAFLNGKQINVSKATKIKDSLIATGFPYYDYSRIDNFMKSLTFFVKNSHGVRRLGSAATDLVYVACGRLEAFYEYSLSPWDVAAGAFIVQEAGGKICDFSGEDNYIFGKEIIASNADVYDEFLGVVKECYN